MGERAGVGGCGVGVREIIGLETRLLVFGWTTDGVGVWVFAVWDLEGGTEGFWEGSVWR